MTIPKTKPHPEWKILFEEFRNADYGTFVPHQNVALLISLPTGSRPYYQTVGRWKKAMLEDAGKEIETKWNEGYRLVQPNEYRQRTHRQIKFARKRSKHAGKIASVAPLELMSKPEAGKMMEMITQVRTLTFFMEETLKKTRLIDKKVKPELEAGDFKAVAD